MKIKQKLIYALAIVSLCSCQTFVPEAIVVPEEKQWTLSSPNNDLKFNIHFNYGKLYYSIKKGNVSVVDESKINFTTEYNDFTALKFISESKQENIPLKYTNVSGKVRNVDTSYSEMKLTFLENDFYFDFLIRTFNDGYGFKYNIRAKDGSEGTMKWIDEGTHFKLPDETVTYSLKYVDNTDSSSNEIFYSYEGNYDKINYKSFGSEAYVYPFLYKVDENVFSLMNEADLIGSNYHGSMLQKNGEDGLKIIHSKACGTNPGDTISYPFSSPWRVASVGTLSECVGSSIFESVLGEVETYKPDNYEELSTEEKEIYNYDWVEPGAGVWNYLKWRAEYQSNFEWQKNFVDLAHDMGWKWIILDAEWNMALGNSGWKFTVSGFKNFTSYAHSKGIKVMCWANIFSTFSSKSVMKIALDNWKYYGIDGVKIDFWDGMYNDDISAKSKMESKETIELYEAFYQETAKRQMVVDCHGCNKPTGERRRYPHVINREGIMGEEFTNRSISNNVLLPITRGAVGPSDFTPATKPLFNKKTTIGANLALAVTLESGCPTFSGEIEEYLNPETRELTTAGEFYKNIPVVWDETKVISYDLDNVSNLALVMARRSGDTWYIGGTVTKSREVPVDLSFLSDGEYQCRTFYDGETKETLLKKIDNVNNKSKLNVKCPDNGGFTMIITKK